MNIDITSALSTLSIQYEYAAYCMFKLNVKRALVLSMFIDELPLHEWWHTFDSRFTACSVLCDVNNIRALSQSATRMKPSFEYFISCFISSSDTKDGL